MTNIHHFTHNGTDIIPDAALTAWTDKMLKHLPASVDNINVIHCTDDELLEVNQNYLNHDYYTDIITFDLRENNTDPLEADLFISTDRIRENAEIHGVEYDEELRRVIIHGILHLCGFGDKSEKESALMREQENFYLSL